MMFPTDKEIKAVLWGYAGALLAIGACIGLGGYFLARFVANHLH